MSRKKQQQKHRQPPPQHTPQQSSMENLADILFSLAILIGITYIFSAFYETSAWISTTLYAITVVFGLLFAFLSWRFPPSKGSGGQRLTLLSLWRSRLVRIGAVILVVALILIKPILFFLPHPNYVSIPNTSYTGVLVLKDSLISTDVLSNPKDRPWAEFTSKEGFCRLTASGYQVGALERIDQFCPALGTDYSDFAVKIEMTMLKADSSDQNGGGIYFRSTTNHSEYFNVFISQLGARALSAVSNGNWRTKKDEQFFITGTDHTYVIEAIVHGDETQVCIDNFCYKNLPAPTSSHGEIGVFAQNATGQTEVQFNSVEVWKL